MVISREEIEVEENCWEYLIATEHLNDSKNVGQCDEPVWADEGVD